jgi:hypothetical protein
LACFTVQTARAQQTTPASHVPSQIQQAQTIFLTNSGSDPNFPIDATKAYNDIYTALQTWGRYKLVNSPDQADLVFELKGIAPVTDVSGNRGGVTPSRVRPFSSPSSTPNPISPSGPLPRP